MFLFDFRAPVESHCRSRMNATFRIGSRDGVEELEKRFVDEAFILGMISLKGHRSVGGIRVSMYNALSVDDVQTLCTFMHDFQKRNQ